MGFNYARYKSLIGNLSKAEPAGVYDLVASQLGFGNLYNFTTFTFTSGGQNGRLGPSLATLLASYNTGANPWLTNTSFFNMVTNGIQLWTVPVSGTYRIRAIGGRGGTVSATRLGGFGADMQGDFALIKGTVLAILVGQSGVQTPISTGNKGGGGGSFVWNNGTNDLLIAAGGGGGSQNSASGVNASITTSGTTKSDGTGTAGINGNGTTNGAGWLTNATLGANAGTIAASSPLNGGTGGDGFSTTHVGGFGGGGGGGGSPSTTAAGGGGGGYSGGAGLGTPATVGGGGGGSFNGGTNQSNSVGTAAGNGSVIITLL